MLADHLPLFARSMAQSRRALIGWSLGLAVVAVLYLPLYPSMGSSPEMQTMIESLPPEMVAAMGWTDFSTGAGYVQATVLGLLGFVLFTIAAVNWGTAAIAGDEEHGGLELTLAHGVSRTQLVLERTAALLVRILVLGGVLGLLLLLLNRPSSLGLEPAHAAAAIVAMVGLALLIGLAAVAAGALVRSKPVALLAGTGVAVFGYVSYALGNQSPELDWLHAVSPYYWAFGSEPLSTGFAWGGLGLLYGCCAVLFALALWGLNRRDVGV